MSSTSRPYQSTLRKAQAAQTREHLLATAYAFFEDHDATDLSMTRLAKLAGVAVGTVYKHFPSEEALLEAFQGYFRERTGLQGDRALTETGPLQELPLKQFPLYHRHRKVMTWAVYSRAWFRLRQPMAQAQHAAWVARLRPMAPNLSDHELGCAAGAVFLQSAPRVWNWYDEYWGLDTEDAARVSAWAMSVLLDSLSQDPERFRQALTSPFTTKEQTP